MVDIKKNITKSMWQQLSVRASDNNALVQETVKDIMTQVKTQGDDAIRYYNEKFDKNTRVDFQIDSKQLQSIANELENKLKDALDLAYNNIYTFHSKQQLKEEKVEVMEGLTCWRVSRPIERVGLYIPGGSAPLFSSLLMLGIPAQIAGCSETILCTPCTSIGAIHPAIAYLALKIGITKVFGIGGAQAIAAMTYGTMQVHKVDKIFGPGNQYVTQAKVMAQLEGIAIDMPAGPSEVLIIADATSNPTFVASDMISQMEHGGDSQAIVCTSSEQMAIEIKKQLIRQINQLNRAAIIKAAAEWSKILVFPTLEDCIAFSNFYAPEHLILGYTSAASDLNKINNAGSIFLGKWSCESLGDYASGTNHTLPTSGYARAYSGVSLDSFMKKITVQQVSKSGLNNIGPAVIEMANAEGLDGHAAAVTVRLNSINQ